MYKISLCVCEGCYSMMEVELADVWKLQDHYPQGIVWEYDVDMPFKLQAWAAKFIELTCLGLARERAQMQKTSLKK